MPLDVESVLARETESDFQVATRAYRGAELFQLEMERIFHRTWIYLCHETEIAKPGDFKSLQVGQQPVVAVRDRDGSIKAFYNICRHRGAALCREEYGNVGAFVCPYHGWTYRTNGELFNVNDRDGYPPEFTTHDKGLIPLPRIESYAGLVFGCLDPDVCDLETHLGGAKAHLDLWHARCAGGRYVANFAHKYKYPGNWKFQNENVIDGYHVGTVHRGAFEAIRKFAPGDFKDVFTGPVREVGRTRGIPGGHSTLEGDFISTFDGASEEIKDAYRGRIAARSGADNVREVLSNRHLFIFPNLAVMDANIRVIQPIAHDRTDVYSYFVSIEGAEDEINAARLADTQSRIGSAGIVGCDDIEIFEANQTGLRVDAVDWLVLSRGMQREERLPSGERIGRYTDETPQRAFWRQWNVMMAGTNR